MSFERRERNKGARIEIRQIWKSRDLFFHGESVAEDNHVVVMEDVYYSEIS